MGGEDNKGCRKLRRNIREKNWLGKKDKDRKRNKRKVEKGRNEIWNKSEIKGINLKNDYREGEEE